MQFILLGFDQRAEIRRYAFQGIVDRTRTEFTVRVDLSLIPRYGIHMQDLPLLCRELLERRGEAAEKRALTFTEEEMGNYAHNCKMAREAAALRKKTPRRSPSTLIGSAWRGPQV